MAKSDVPPPHIRYKNKMFWINFPLYFIHLLKLDDRSRPQMTAGVMSEPPPSTVGGLNRHDCLSAGTVWDFG